MVAKLPAKEAPPATGNLSALLDEEKWALVGAAFFNLDVEAHNVAGLAPACVAHFVTHEWLLDYPILASAFVERATSKGHSLIAIQAGPERGHEIYGIKYLRMVLANVAAKRDEVEQTIRTYRAGNAEALARIAERSARGTDRPDLHRKLYRAMGTTWLARARPRPAKGGMFVALDFDEALHPDGALASLRSSGYGIERIGAGTPPTLPTRARPQNRS